MNDLAEHVSKNCPENLFNKSVCYGPCDPPVFPQIRSFHISANVIANKPDVYLAKCTWKRLPDNVYLATCTWNRLPGNV